MLQTINMYVCIYIYIYIYIYHIWYINMYQEFKINVISNVK
jgi:hypothetical protein